MDERSGEISAGAELDVDSGAGGGWDVKGADTLQGRSEDRGEDSIATCVNLTLSTAGEQTLQSLSNSRVDHPRRVDDQTVTDAVDLLDGLLLLLDPCSCDGCQHHGREALLHLLYRWRLLEAANGRNRMPLWKRLRLERRLVDDVRTLMTMLLHPDEDGMRTVRLA